MHERLFLWRICTLIGTSCVFQKIKKKKKKKKKKKPKKKKKKGIQNNNFSKRTFYDQIIFEWDFLNKTLQ